MASKFQKADSTNLFVGISEKLNVPSGTEYPLLQPRHIPHVKENGPELFSNLQQWMESATISRLTCSGEVVLLERSIFPSTSALSH